MLSTLPIRYRKTHISTDIEFMKIPLEHMYQYIQYQQYFLSCILVTNWSKMQIEFLGGNSLKNKE